MRKLCRSGPAPFVPAKEVRPHSRRKHSFRSVRKGWDSEGVVAFPSASAGAWSKKLHRQKEPSEGRRDRALRVSRAPAGAPALTTNLLEPRTGGIGIHRHIARPGLHDSKDGGDRGGRFVQINTDPISARNTVCDQAARNLVTKPIQLAAGERLVQESPRLVLPLRSGSFCQQLVKSESHPGSLTQDRLASPVAPFGCRKKLVFPVSSDAN